LDYVNDGDNPAHQDIGNRCRGTRSSSIAVKYDNKFRFPETVAAMATKIACLEDRPAMADLQGKQA